MDTERPTNPADARRLPSRSRAVLIGATIQLILAVWGGWYLLTPQPQPTRPRQLVNEVLIPEDMVYPDTDQGVKIGKKLPPIEMKEMAAANPLQLKAGAGLFAQNCASCHGPGGKGDGPAGVTLSPRPRDLTALNTWKNGTRTSDIFRTISLGLSGTKMSSFDFLLPQERLALAHLVASLAPGHAQDTAESLQSLDRQFSLSQGVREPSMIPVSMAMDKLVVEAAAGSAGSTRSKRGGCCGGPAFQGGCGPAADVHPRILAFPRLIVDEGSCAAAHPGRGRIPCQRFSAAGGNAGREQLGSASPISISALSENA